MQIHKTIGEIDCFKKILSERNEAAQVSLFLSLLKLEVAIEI